MPSLTAEPPDVSESPRPARPPFRRRLLISILRFVAVLLTAALVGSGWYLARKGFGRKWREIVVQELHKRGVEASVAHLTLDPFRGLVAKDVRVYDYKHRENTIALISKVALEINYAALLHHKPFLNALDIRNAQVSLPLAGAGKAGSGPAQLTRFRAHIYFPPEQIFVSQADGLFCGIHISASGQLLKRENALPSKPLSEEEWQERLRLLERLMTELRKFQFGTAPSLQIKFSGDLADLENGVAEATLHARKITRGPYECEDLHAAVEFRDQLFSVNELQWTDHAGAFNASGSWSRRKNEANFQARSRIDIKTLLAAFNSPLLADFTFNPSPVLTVSGNASFGTGSPHIKIIGNVNAGELSYRQIPASQLNANFSWNGHELLIRDVHLQSQGGQLSAELLNAPGDFRLNIDSTVNPGGLRPFLSTGMQEFLGEWEWPRPPSVHLMIRGTDEKPQTWHGDGTISMERARFRNVWMNSGTAKVHFADGAVSYQDIKVVRNEGTGSGDFTYDFVKHEVRIGNITTSLWPNEVVFWVDPDLNKVVTPYKFRQPPLVTTRGVYQFDGGKNTRLELKVEGKGGMNYVFVGKTLPLDRISANLIITDDRLQIRDLTGTLFSGTLRGEADISLARNDARYHAKLDVQGVDFPRLTDLYYDYKTAHGQLAGTYDFTGVGSDARKMRGTGKMEVTNGDVFAIPVFGPLSGILNSVLPGNMGYSIGRKADANFTIKDGVIHTDNFEVAGKLFRMEGHGDIYFLDDKLDFTVGMTGNGPVALLTPMYKLFEYSGEGSLKQPNWHPKRF